MTDVQSTPRRQMVPGPVPPPPPPSASKAASVWDEGVKVRDVDHHVLQEEPRPPAPVGNLAKGIAGVMSEVGNIKKGGYNKFHQYHYARLEDLLEAITPLMGKHGVVVIQNEVNKQVIENRMAVTYEFSIIHSSGEVWPERPRFTGMTLGRDSKGNWDDKAINKCHSAARKYFLLALFQVPAGDFDDADTGSAPPVPVPQQERRAPVPGPAPHRTPTPAPSSVPHHAPEPVATGPHHITLGGGAGADGWAAAYIKAIGTATTGRELHQWDQMNGDTLQRLSDRYPAIYDMIATAFETRLNELGAPPTDQMDAETGEITSLMPDPKVDATVAVNWVGQQLNDFKTWDAAATFWDAIVMPRANEFTPEDYELVQAELRRAEARLAA